MWALQGQARGSGRAWAPRTCNWVNCPRQVLSLCGPTSQTPAAPGQGGHSGPAEQPCSGHGVGVRPRAAPHRPFPRSCWRGAGRGAALSPRKVPAAGWVRAEPTAGPLHPLQVRAMLVPLQPVHPTRSGDRGRLGTKASPSSEPGGVRPAQALGRMPPRPPPCSASDGLTPSGYRRPWPPGPQPVRPRPCDMTCGASQPCEELPGRGPLGDGGHVDTAARPPRPANPGPQVPQHSSRRASSYRAPGCQSHARGTHACQHHGAAPGWGAEGPWPAVAARGHQEAQLQQQTSWWPHAQGQGAGKAGPRRPPVLAGRTPKERGPILLPCPLGPRHLPLYLQEQPGPAQTRPRSPKALCLEAPGPPLAVSPQVWEEATGVLQPHPGPRRPREPSPS